MLPEVRIPVKKGTAAVAQPVTAETATKLTDVDYVRFERIAVSLWAVGWRCECGYVIKVKTAFLSALMFPEQYVISRCREHIEIAHLGEK